MFHNMEYVYRVYTEKSFSKAAEKLYISQPSLSATIKKVESRIGSPLFDRSTNPVRLTDCGAEYIKCIEQIMDIQNGFKNYVNDFGKLMVGNVTVGGSSFFSSYILPPIISHFRQAHPRVAVSLVEADTAHLEHLLFEGSLDMILDNYHFNEALYKKELFCTERLVWASSKKLALHDAVRSYQLSVQELEAGLHMDPATPALPLELLAGAPLIRLRYGNDTRTRFDSIFEDQGIVPDIVLELDQLVTAYHIASTGMGVTLVSDTIATKVKHYPDTVFYKVDSPHATRNNCIYFKHSKYVTKPMEVFLETALQEGRRISCAGSHGNV